MNNNNPIVENIIKHIGTVEELQKEVDRLKAVIDVMQSFHEYVPNYYYCAEKGCMNILVSDGARSPDEFVGDCDQFFNCSHCCKPRICNKCIDKTDLLIHYRYGDWSDDYICKSCYETDLNKCFMLKKFLIIDKKVSSKNE